MRFTKLLALGGAVMAGVCAASVALAQTGPQTDEAEAPPPPPFQSQELAQGPWTLSTEAADIRVDIVTRELERPWGMAFLPDGAMLVTERPGRLRIIRDGALDPQPIAGLPPIFAFGIGGLTDVVLHPDFANNGLIYLSYSKAAPEAGENPTVQADSALAVIRARWDGGYELTDVEEIFLAAPWYGAPPVPERCCGQ